MTKSKTSSQTTKKTDAGLRVIAFIEKVLKITRGADVGKPFKLRPWQKQIVRDIFGTLRPDGTRRYRKCYISMGRRNGKSYLIAAVALYCLLSDGEVFPNIVIGACTKDQAKLIFNFCVEMIQASPVLAKRIRKKDIVPSQRRIRDPKSGGEIRAVSSDAYGNLGSDYSLVILDEINFHQSNDLHNALDTSTGSRRQGLVIYISTASFNKKGIGYQHYLHSKKVQADPDLDPAWYSAIYEVPADADWTDEKNFILANPAYGDFRNADELREYVRRAKILPELQSAVRVYYLNQWADSKTTFIPYDRWMKCKRHFSERDIEGAAVWLGLDLAKTQDFSALVLIAPVNDEFYILPYFFVPEEGLYERSVNDGMNDSYVLWRDQGLIKTSPGARINYEVIRAEMNRLRQKFDIQEVAFDEYGAQYFADRLRDEDGYPMIPVRQVFRTMTEPTGEFRGLILDGKIVHNNNPVMNWMVRNFEVARDARGMIMPDKSNVKNKIDGVSAAVTALDRVVRNQNKQAVDCEPTVMFL